MKPKTLSLVLIFFLLITFTGIIKGDSDNMNNPFYKKYMTPYETPDFSKIKITNYLPAFKKGILEHKKEIDAIANNSKSPTFPNTIEALDSSGKLLTKVENVFFNLLSAETNKDMQKIAKTVSPLLSKHGDDILLNKKLFIRIKELFNKKEKLNLNIEQKMLLKHFYELFAKNGANLKPEDKKILRKINKELSLLTLNFGDNVLAENNRFKLVITKKEDLDGLPQTVIDAAAITAKNAGLKNSWVFTIHKPSLIPFLQYSKKRDLREKMFRAYIMKGDHNDKLDNKENIKKIVMLRLKKANLLGYKTHAAYILSDNMAKTADKVYDLLKKIWVPALKVAKKEAAELQKMIDKSGEKFKLKPWDWWYYSEKLRKEKYDLDESQLRPYFELENVRKGVFYTASRLYGLKFIERKDIPVYNKEVKVYQIKDSTGKDIGIIYTDYFPRPGKQGGAWMNAYRKEKKTDGKRIIPIVCNVGNFSRPTKDKPALLSIDEVKTMFHEFGHAMHGLLANTTYRTLSGTEVARDFVELPSQINENWALEPEVLKIYARHYKTGKVIPMELVEKIKNSSHFNQGFATVEYLAAAFLDMDWHTITEKSDIDVNKFEKNSMDKIGLISEIVVRYRSTYFSHIFSGGYSAGYYSYAWAEVLDADAFAYFKKNGIFNRKIAESFRKNILEKGGTEEPMKLYKKFRGAEPKIEPMLKRKGLLD